MTQHIELKTPCPDCRGRLTLSVRHTPLLGWHAVRLACENGCDLHWYYYDLPNGRAWFSTVEQCADYHDGVIRREGGGERADTGVRMPKLRGVPARVKQKHRTPDVPHRHMPVRILLGRGPALSALRMADGDQEQEERGHPRKNRPFHDVSGGTRLPVLRRAGVCPHHRDRR